MDKTYKYLGKYEWNKFLDITSPSSPVCHLTLPSFYISSISPKLPQFSSVTQSCLTIRNPMNHRMPGLPVHHQLPEFTQTQVIESMMPSNHLIFCRPLLLLPPIPPSIRVFPSESTLCMRSFSFSISPSDRECCCC